MENIQKLRKFYHLKNVERNSSVKDRKESSAEHSWSCLILADYFLSLLDNHEIKLDRLKVYELLMYHDLVEIEAGDVPIHHEKERENKKAREIEAMKKDFPEVIKEKVWDLFVEFEEEKTAEAKFAKAIDKIDALVHELDYKQRWKGWTEEMVRKFHGKKVGEFKELEDVFDKIMKFCHQEGYFKEA